MFDLVPFVSDSFMAVAPAIAAALVGGGASLLGNVFSSIFGGNSTSVANKRTIEAQKYMQERQNEMNIENWKMQNEYNTPANQMKRLQEAGLNPNLVYGNGADTTAGSIPSVSSYNPEFRPENTYAGLASGIMDSVKQALAFYLQTRQMELSNDSIISEIEKNNAERDYVLSRRDGQDITNGILSKDLNLYNDTYGDRVLGYSLQNRQKESSIGQSEAAIAQSKANTALLQAKTRMSEHEINLVDARVTLAIQQAITESAKRAGLNAETALKLAMTPHLVEKAKHEAYIKANDRIVSDWNTEHGLHELQYEFQNHSNFIKKMEGEIRSWENYDIRNGLKGHVGDFVRPLDRLINSIIN